MFLSHLQEETLKYSELYIKNRNLIIIRQNTKQNENKYERNENIILSFKYIAQQNGC